MTKPKPILRSLTVRLEAEACEAVEAAAREERRPVANLLRLAIDDYIARRSSRGSAAAA